MLKKFISTVLVLSLVFASFVPSINVNAASNDNRTKVLKLSEDNTSLPYSNLEININNKGYFRSNFKNIHKDFDSVLISRSYLNELDTSDLDKLSQLIDNGIVVSVYGDNLQMEDIKKLFHDYDFNNDNKVPAVDTNQGNRTLVSIDNINGYRVYTEVIDASNTVFTDSNGNKLTAAEISAKENKTTKYKHDPINFLDSIIKNYKNLLINKIKQDEPSNIVTPQLPPSPSGEPYISHIDYSDLATVTSTTYPYKVYSSSSTHWWDIVNSSTVTPKSDRYIDSFTIGLHCNYATESFIDWTNLPSKSYSASVSLSSQGTPSVSYSVSTAEQDITNSSITKGMEWHSEIVPNQSFWYPGYSPKTGPYKLEPGIRLTNTDGSCVVRFTHVLEIASILTGLRYTSSTYSNYASWPDF